MNVQFWQNREKRQIDPQLFSETAETLAKKSTRNGWDHGTN